MRYTENTRFQQAKRPTALNLAEGKRYFSKEHKVYGFKSEVLLVPNGIRICSSANAPGNVADITVFEEICSGIELRLKKWR